MTLRLEVFPDEEWAAACASRFDRLLSGLARPRLCLPTGDTMAPFYREVATRSSLDGATIFLLDEFGGLPEGDPGRCETMLEQHLLQLVTGEPELVVPEVDTPDTGASAARYQSQIEDGGLDLAILGLGGNGHIGMNEPGSEPGSATRVVSLKASTTDHAREAYGATVPPTWGMTVGLEQILAARRAWLMVTGRHKAEILKRALTDPIGTDLPATYLRKHRDAIVLADASAAALL